MIILQNGLGLFIRQMLKLYIRKFIEKYYAPGGVGYNKRKEHFESCLYKIVINYE